MTLNELSVICKARGIQHTARKKADFVARIRLHQSVSTTRYDSLTPPVSIRPRPPPQLPQSSASPDGALSDVPAVKIWQNALRMNADRMDGQATNTRRAYQGSGSGNGGREGEWKRWCAATAGTTLCGVLLPDSKLVYDDTVTVSLRPTCNLW